MEIQDKLAVLKSLDTKSLVEKLKESEDSLEKAMREEADFKAKNHGYLGSGDCQEVKTLEAELMAQSPEFDNDGKKLTIDKRNAWLLRQRTENKEISDAIVKQRQVSFLCSDYQIRVEMARRRLESIKAILNLKRAQIEFLAGSE